MTESTSLSADRSSPLRFAPRCARRSLGVASVLATAAALAALVPDSAEGAPAPLTPWRVVIDPGHGGSDPGAIGNGIVEKEINLETALRLAQLLELDTLDTTGGSEWEVQMTRTGDLTVSLSARTNQANAWGADLFVSIHHNAFSSPSANGTETFSFTNGSPAAVLRDRVQEELLDAHGLTDRGSKTANFFVLRETFMPAILSEAGFLSSPIDSAVLSEPDAVERSALAHLFALQRYRGVAPHEPNSGPTNYCTAKTSSIGCVPHIFGIGEASLSSATPFRVVCENVVSQQFGLMIWSRQSAAIPFYGGTLCLGGNLVRRPVQFSNGFGPNDCSGRLETELSAAYLQAVGVQFGEALHAQYWFRDPLAQIPVGLSEGLRFIVMP